jgi:hypothetical protein
MDVGAPEDVAAPACLLDEVVEERHPGHGEDGVVEESVELDRGIVGVGVERDPHLLQHVAEPVEVRGTDAVDRDARGEAFQGGTRYSSRISAGSREETKAPRCG